ncbi:MAG: hypothetical protein K0V04_44910 [Deltaproteobacteria bacterium]|nr:hypothetical protein [Deltaproteobacteria bacterium]
MKHLGTLVLMLGLLVGFACMVDDDRSDLEDRIVQLKPIGPQAQWPCWPNCPDPAGECFGECFNGVAYCDHPDCCVDPDNCLCYDENSPVSQALCDPSCDDCFGECIGGSYCDNPECCIDEGNCVCYAPEHAISQVLCGPAVDLCADCGVLDTSPDAPPVAELEPVVLPAVDACDMCFGECINGGYCDSDPECCIQPDQCLCYDPSHPISQILCGGGCFGECIGGGYCDAPGCCIEDDNCMCYAPWHPISEFMCR